MGLAGRHVQLQSKASYRCEGLQGKLEWGKGEPAVLHQLLPFSSAALLYTGCKLCLLPLLEY